MIHWQKTINLRHIHSNTKLWNFFEIKITRTKSLDSGVVVGGGGGEIRRSNDISFTSVKNK